MRFGPVPCNCVKDGERIPSGLAGYCQSNCDKIEVEEETQCRQSAEGIENTAGFNYLFFPQKALFGASSPEFLLISREEKEEEEV